VLLEVERSRAALAQVRVSGDVLQHTHAVVFKARKARLKKASVPVLAAVAEFLDDHPELGRVTIEVHTDELGDAAKDQALSDKRAKVLAKFLVRKGKVAADRLVPAGKGASEPVTKPDAPEGRARNRRVVFRVEKSE